MKKKRVVFLVAAAIAAIGSITLILGMRDKTAYVEKVSEQEVQDAFRLLSDSLDFGTVRYQEYIAVQEAVYGLEDMISAPSGKETEEGYEDAVVSLDYEETACYTINVKKSGVYSLGLDYHTGGTNLSDYRVAVTINGKSYFEEMSMVTLPLLWTDATKNFPVDRYGDETVPEQIRVDDWQYQDLYNTSYYTADPLYFYLESGKNEICIQNVSADGLVVGKLYIKAIE